MGREARCTIRWKGQAAEVRVQLEPGEIVLRGDLRARIPRSALTGAEAEGPTLVVATTEGRLELDLGPALCDSWLKALMAPPPTLAEKLGADAGHPVFVLGHLSDEALLAALAGRTTDRIEAAGLFLAEMRTLAQMTEALGLALTRPDRPIWCVYPKGKGAVPSDAEVRGHFRASGFIDTKSCAVSARMTATRYHRPARWPA